MSLYHCNNASFIEIAKENGLNPDEELLAVRKDHPKALPMYVTKKDTAHCIYRKLNHILKPAHLDGERALTWVELTVTFN